MAIRPEDLLMLAEVARSGSLAHAASVLGVDHTTVSRRLDRLDRQVGAATVIRTSGGTRLTDLGKSLLGPASQIEAAVHAAQELGRSGEGTHQLRGLLRVMCPEGFGTMFVTPAAARLQRRHPQLQIELVTGTHPITQGVSADVEISVGKPERRHCRHDRLAGYHLGLYASRGYLDEHGPVDSVDQISCHKLVYYIESMLLLDQLVLAERHFPEASIGFASPNLFSQLAATNAGAGIGLLPRFVVLGNDNLVRLAPDFHVTREFYAAIAERPTTRTLAAALVRAVHREIERRADELVYPN
ncbi:LysR family transcriptional regulator [uncultured Tessaracoccus sp.]|uniref:LysR family transcriptional regulator n=1 Tax=uncultured Tessaracoccus sp. TaxID=905023 RepID=UPI0025F7636B|nr:LysR family transcriptional regulator [uncultured Tessaracoccus sp.]